MGGEVTRRCARCGRKPPLGYAGASIGKKAVTYCHPDDENEPDCYSLSSAEGYPEITGKKTTPLERLFLAVERIGVDE